MVSTRLIRTGLVFFGLACVGFACTPTPSPSVQPDVVLLLIDTLRKDHVGSYGYQRPTTPTLDSLATECLQFDDAVAQSSWTLPSLTSLFSSRYVNELPKAVSGGPLNLKLLLTAWPSDDMVMLAELLRDGGYHTVSVSTNPYNHDAINVMQGFEKRMFKINARADWVVDSAIAELDATTLRRSNGDAAPLFLYLHFMDVHPPLQTPDAYARLFLNPALELTDDEPNGFAPNRFINAKGLAGGEFDEHRDRLIAQYDGGLRFIDDQLKRLVEHLRQTGLREETVLVVASDHGEEFWEHAELGSELGLENHGAFGLGHGHTLFPELIEVPLMICKPGITGARIGTQVRNIDITPTLVALAGVANAGWPHRGVNLLDGYRPRVLGDLPALSEVRSRAADQRSLRVGRLQFLRIGADDLVFDRKTFDREEAPKAKVRALASALDALFFGPIAGQTPTANLDEDLLKDLRSLGYLE